MTENIRFLENPLFGAIIGDIAGSRFEWRPTKSKDFDLFHEQCKFTDDTVMTCAIADALLQYYENKFPLDSLAIYCMQKWGQDFPNSGYGGNFYGWIWQEDPKPYYSYGNGSAMRVSACGFLAKNLEEAKKFSLEVTKVTHNHPEGLKGAEALTCAIFLARQGKNIQEIKKYIEDNYYDFPETLDEIRKYYRFDVTCQGSVPQALLAFFESTSYEDAIRNAISLGGDTDTQGAIAGAVAAAYYGIPPELVLKSIKFLHDDILELLLNFSRHQSTNNTL